jgi:beta-1,4-mannosyl-glycoprotein beta-1,4-N-acetylglucosaminyltransferase
LAWNDLQTGDVLLISDCDEIIRPESISFIRNSSYDYYALMSPIFNFKFNYLNTSNEYTVWPVAYRYYPDVDYVPSGMRRVSNERDLFRHRFGEGILLHHAAWHFSSLGNDEFVKNKLKSFSHTEFNTSEYVDNVNIDKHIIENKNHIQSAQELREIRKNYMQKRDPNHLQIEDIGSGLNFNRRGLRKIIKYAISGKIEEMVSN